MTILTHEIMTALKNIQYWIEITQYFNRFDKIHNYNVDNSMRWGWVVQICTQFEEQFGGPWRQGNDPCKFCRVQHGSSEVTVQYRVFLVSFNGR